jgi:hypothetical protein
MALGSIISGITGVASAAKSLFGSGSGSSGGGSKNMWRNRAKSYKKKYQRAYNNKEKWKARAKKGTVVPWIVAGIGGVASIVLTIVLITKK